MARINIEDSVWSDSRFMKLCIKLGDERLAIGALVLSWKIAQRFWCPDKKAVPLQDWETTGIGDEIIEVGLASYCEEGVYVSGCEKHFSWWFQRRTAGIKSGEARRVEKPLKLVSPKKGTVVDSRSTTVQRPFNDRSTTANELEPLPLSLSLSLSRETKTKNSVEAEISASRPLISLPEKITGEWVRDQLPKTSWRELTSVYDDEVHWIEAECRKMAVWAAANRHKCRKTPRGWNQFITNWLSRNWDKYAQNRAKPPLKIDHDKLWGKPPEEPC